ncbi:hypothetical protein SCP_1101100 [Sparassis crispa]|uniref:Uncharacterized protein n=1 Tax=Sparassis crispa TaxID=139825 RepID=A0A401GZ49_9APHY|nr:hypothetical protein SCP_1101100 [Sparassis crispa]GBE87434.1 hypothetical protein SCP_1101100 [Sparassis crispa]
MAVSIVPMLLLQVNTAPLIAVPPMGSVTLAITLPTTITPTATGTVVLASTVSNIGPSLQTTSLITGHQWYTVTWGLEIGVFKGWTVVQPLVIRVTSSTFEKGPLYQDTWCKYCIMEALDCMQLLTVP